MAPATERPAPLWKRLVWFAAIWAGSIVGLAAVATLLRFWLKS